ncbi:DUF3572 domain-containing protein [Allorhizobium taibaishanense]|uniref:DUF3572 domain-containing protein n=1 Tax=Allorhizobium taibaishanense TaxID=887144 RepID=A0A1Q8ZYP4_9HYPH|nr:DUF3572 domain-containing protein [Allorhizobium taibaishanense]MBB4007620.1 hypothetical protein [Allorhizobium taibaishanense]OLP47453.1 hypothetical protein BJF91_03265 [Allorhizobium taibaishanense]
MQDKTIKTVTKDHAEQTAVAVLAWLAGEPDMLARFLSLTGVEPGQVRDAVNNPDFLAGLLDFLMQHEPTLLDFCNATQTPPQDVISAYHVYVRPALDSGEI